VLLYKEQFSVYDEVKLVALFFEDIRRQLAAALYNEVQNTAVFADVGVASNHSRTHKIK
jgi:hypothetical protein